MEQLSSHWMDFHEIWYMGLKKKTSQENSSVIKIGQE